jgi:hypothetical protein
LHTIQCFSRERYQEIAAPVFVASLGFYWRARFAAFGPKKPTPGFLGAAALRPAAQGNFFANLFGTAPQALLAIARVSLGAQAVP